VATQKQEISMSPLTGLPKEFVKLERAAIRNGIPKGKTRVVGIDLFASEDCLVGDFDDREEAFTVADEHNKTRRGSMDDVYYVYDDTGELVRNEEAVKESTGDLGVSP
jgi:hypothetical protein